MPPRDDYAIGRCGSYDVSTVVKIDAHLRALRQRLTTGLPPRQRIAGSAVWMWP